MDPHLSGNPYDPRSELASYVRAEQLASHTSDSAPPGKPHSRAALITAMIIILAVSAAAVWFLLPG